MRNPRLLCDGQGIHMRLIIDGPGVFWRASARSHTRDQRIEALAAKAIAGEGSRVGDVAEPDGAALQQLRAVVWSEHSADACPGPHKTHNVVTAPHQRAHRRTTDGASGAEDEDPFCVSGRIMPTRTGPVPSVSPTGGAFAG